MWFKSSRFLIMAAILVALLIPVGVAVWGYPRAAVYVLALLCVVAAAGRMLNPDPHVWFAAKDWQIDCGFFLALALGLCILAPLANASVR